MNGKPLPAQAVQQNEPARYDSADDAALPRGRLKVYLSYAPGTGKTLAMLQDGYRKLADGVDVVAGFVDAGGDLLALRLLERIEALPHHVVNAAGITYTGMNLDMLLARRPQLALVDHLAQANPPGQRHVARYLEVEELLHAGIDVYTTLNVYQIESQSDAVASLTGVAVRETVPDRLLDMADAVQMVDTPPQSLLERYHAGAIAIPLRAQIWLERFFQPTNLFALRELALRLVAQRANVLMHAYLERRGMVPLDTAAPRLLVCISESGNAAGLIRAARRMADETRAAWTVIHIETPDQMRPGSSAPPAVAQHMRLAELLGADTEILTGRSVIETVRAYVRENNIRRVVVGRSPRRWQQLLGGSLAEQLVRHDPSISVYVVGGDQTPQPVPMPGFGAWVSRLQLLGSLALVALPTLLGLVLSPTIISRSANLIMLYILSVVIAAVFLGWFAALLTAVLSVLAFDFFFIPPLFRFFQFAPEYALTFASLLALSLLISSLVARERSLARAARRRADQVTQLYELSRDLAAAVDMREVLDTVLQHVQETFHRDAVILLPKDGALELTAASAGSSLDSSELTAAEWALQQGRPAGNHTGTFSYASYRYFPLETSRGNIGVLGVRMSGGLPDLHPEQMRQLSVYITKAASSIERALFAEQASQAEILRATEKLQSALLNSISHDLRTPLASITGVLDSLRMDDGFLDAESRGELVETAYGEAVRLNRLVGNLLDMSRLESGNIHITLQPCDIQDVIGAALNATAARLEGHPVAVVAPPELPLVPLDFVLVNQVLINLLDNAAKYSAEDGPIMVNAARDGEYMRVAVEDEGPGIPEEDRERIFEKFYRVKRFENVVGTGLGLSICKGIVEVHGGSIRAENRPGGGLRLVFTLPLKPPQRQAPEPNAEPLHEELPT